jgi:DnaJ-class molecular chaperone
MMVPTRRKKGTEMPNCTRCGGKGTIKCPDCDGSGRIDEAQLELMAAAPPGAQPCPKCKGTGAVACPICEGAGEVEDNDD